MIVFIIYLTYRSYNGEEAVSNDYESITNSELNTFSYVSKGNNEPPIALSPLKLHKQESEIIMPTTNDNQLEFKKSSNNLLEMVIV